MSRWVNVALLTVAWGALFATLDGRALAFGAAVAFALLVVTGRLHRDRGAPKEREVILRPIGFIRLVGAFVRELFSSAFSVAKEAWRPRIAVRPGLLEIPLEVESDVEITVLASLISLTPGTLSIEVSPDRRSLYVHALIVDDAGETIRASIRDRLERPVQRAFRVRR